MNRVLVAPSAAELAAVVAEAVRVVNAAGKAKRPLAKTPADAVAARVAGEPVGVVRWAGHNLLVTIAWWTDFAGRRHVRVRGINQSHWGTPDAIGDPLGVVYPGGVHTCGGRPVAACGCGAVGAPDAIGWMGERCGPCQDRADEGGPVTPPLVFPGGGDREAIAFTPDGREVVYFDAGSGRVVARDLRTGAVTEAPPHAGRHLAAAAFGPGGKVLLVFDQGRATVWDRAAGTAVDSSPLDNDFGVRVSPSGRFLAHDGGANVYAIDWDDPADPLRPMAAEGEARGGGFDRTGDHWVCLTPDDRFVRLRLPTRESKTLAADVFAAAGLRRDEDDDGRFYLDTRVVAIDPDRDRVCVGELDAEHGLTGPPRLGSLTLASPWRNLEFDDGSDGGMPTRMAFSPCGGYLIAGGDAGLVVYPLADPDTPVKLVARTAAWNDRVHALAFSPDGETLAVGFDADGAGDPYIRLLPWRRLVEIARNS